MLCHIPMKIMYPDFQLVLLFLFSYFTSNPCFYSNMITMQYQINDYLSFAKKSLPWGMTHGVVGGYIA